MFGNSKNQSDNQGLENHTGVPPGLFSDPAGKFAEIYGSALVGQTRMFIAACLLGLVALISVIGMLYLANKSATTPWIVEVNDLAGVVSKPVKIENIKPNQAVTKAELAKFIMNIFTIDKNLTGRFFREANVMTTGLATTKFSAFRVSEKIVERMTKEPNMSRTVKVTSVDISQTGVGFVFLSTEENVDSVIGTVKAKWRVTLKFEFETPRTEAEILQNPLGLFITDMNITQEGK